MSGVAPLQKTVMRQEVAARGARLPCRARRTHQEGEAWPEAVRQAARPLRLCINHS